MAAGASIPGQPVAVVGAGGFIGQALCRHLAERGIPVIAIMRCAMKMPAGVVVRESGALSATSPWLSLLAGASSVVHLASRAHAAVAEDPERWIADEAATASALASGAGAGAVRRLVFLSSIKVHGETTEGRPFRASDPPAPADPYGRAKLGMEQAMAATVGAPPLVTLRPPLVFGPGVKANFARLIRLVDRGLPIPFGSVQNRRSLVYIDNLLELIDIALVHPAAEGGTFLMRDNEEVSTPDLIRAIANALDRRPRLPPCPVPLLRAAARLARQSAAVDRLTTSLQIDDQATRDLLGWQPRQTLANGLATTCQWYRGRMQAPSDFAAGRTPL